MKKNLYKMKLKRILKFIQKERKNNFIIQSIHNFKNKCNKFWSCFLLKITKLSSKKKNILFMIKLIPSKY